MLTEDMGSFGFFLSTSPNILYNGGHFSHYQEGQNTSLEWKTSKFTKGKQLKYLE